MIGVTSFGEIPGEVIFFNLSREFCITFMVFLLDKVTIPRVLIRNNGENITFSYILHSKVTFSSKLPKHLMSVKILKTGNQEADYDFRKTSSKHF